MSVRCAQTCFVEGSLTAWKVTAEAIHLEDTAKANIVLQETERLEVGHGARLVGNFKDEKELFYLFSRFAGELRALPIFSERKRVAAGDSEPEQTPLQQALIGGVGEEPSEEAVEIVETGGTDGDMDIEADTVSGDGTLPDPLFFSLVILEREFTRPSYGPTSQRAIEELVKLLRDRDLETLRLTYRTLFGRIVEPGKDVQRVYDLLKDHFRKGASAG